MFLSPCKLTLHDNYPEILRYVFDEYPRSVIGT